MQASSDLLGVSQEMEEVVEKGLDWAAGTSLAGENALMHDL